MMPYEMVTHDMLKDIFAGTKKLFKLKEVKFIQAPKYDEISVKNLYDRFIKLEGMVAFFPAKYAKGRQCDREYMFNVTNTLHPKMVKEVVEFALKQRFIIKDEDQK